MGYLRDNLMVVIHQIRSPDNLGAVARLIANFGYHHLILSEPRTYTFRAAEKLAVQAEARLDTMQLATDLRSAIEGAVFACGTTSRREVKGRTVLSPEVGIARLSSEARRGKVALVFGGEKRGLSDAELAVCQEVIAIPTQPVQPSMNLAQAAAVLLYLSSRHVEPPEPQPDAGASLATVHALEDEPPEPQSDAGASLATVHALEDVAREVLLHSGFLNPQAPEHILTELSRSLVRGRLTQREAEMWLSAFQHLCRALKQFPRP